MATTDRGPVESARRDLATARLELIRGHTVYSTIVSTYGGASESSSGTSNPSMAGFDGYTRVTSAFRTQSDTTDYVTITVTVTASVLTDPVAKTLVLAAFP